MSDEFYWYTGSILQRHKNMLTLYALYFLKSGFPWSYDFINFSKKRGPNYLDKKWAFIS